MIDEKYNQPCPCGIVCRTCLHMKNGCKGCLDGGGTESCHIRDCTTAKNLTGCWECDEFPCTHMQQIDDAWRGLNIGLIQSIQTHGPANYAQLALQNIGEFREYGDLRFKTPEEIQAIIAG